MTAPKSDTATIEARQHRLGELLSEGKTAMQAAEVLRHEGYPASDVTVRRDEKLLLPAWREAKLESFSPYAEGILTELEDLKSALQDPTIKPYKRIELALSILDRKVDILGAKAPSKSIHANINPEHSLDYLRFKKATSGLSETQLEEVYSFASALRRTYAPPVMDASWWPVPMEQKELPPVDEFDPETEVANESGS